MLFSCLGVLLKIIATNESTPKVVLHKQSIKVWWSYDQNTFLDATKILKKKKKLFVCSLLVLVVV